MEGELIDDFADLAPWTAVTSGRARLRISADAGRRGAASMRLDYDFAGSGGFVVARRAVVLTLPETWVLDFAVRGAAPRNRFELKLADPSGRNVWWFKREDFEFPSQWQTMRISSSEFDFAWGPAGGGVPERLGAIELAIVAGPGGDGSVWIENLRLEDHTYRAVPRVTSDVAAAGHEATGLLSPGAHDTWRSPPGTNTARLSIDFGRERELGGLVVHWERDRAAATMQVETSDSGTAWTRRFSATACGGARTYVQLPATRTRHLRLDLGAAPGAAGIGIARLEVKPLAVSRSLHVFFQDIAAAARRGDYPRYLANEQTYWTLVGRGDGSGCALLNEEGMLEIGPGAASIEPFLYADGRLLTWADAALSQELADGDLPIPTAVWHIDDLLLRTTAFAPPGDAEEGLLVVRYRIENTAAHPRSLRLFAAVRPFQVTPPWQSVGEYGGVRRIEELHYADGAVWIDGDDALVPLQAPAGFGALAFAQGSLVDFLREGRLPPATAIRDEHGHASGALAFAVSLPPRGSREIHLAIAANAATPAGAARIAGTDPGAALAQSRAAWRDALGAVRMRIDAAPGAVDTMRSAAAHILLCRDGAALQPGPRRYARSWIRDGAVMAAALLRVGRADEAVAFVRWYAQFQNPDGSVPCCVDRNGADRLVEHDSHGQLVFTVMECFRFTGDRELLRDLWPNVRRAVDHIESLRDTRTGAAWITGENRACHGLLPESASHEGYLAHPVHAYWDDLWALRALRDAAAIAAVLGDGTEARRCAALGDSLRQSLRASIAATMAARGVDYVPASVEWADFDPTAIAVAALLDEIDTLPRAALERTFDEYLTGFRRRQRGDVDWANYTPYEVRNVAALARLGWRDAAAEVMAALLADRRPPAWNQWPEIAWRDGRAPAHIGDLPHAWIGAEYILALRSMLVFESDAARTLVVGAGVPDAWLDGDGVHVGGLPTYWGSLDLEMRKEDNASVRVSIAGRLCDPLPAIVVQPPLAGALSAVTVDGRAVPVTRADRVVIATCPATVVLTTTA